MVSGISGDYNYGSFSRGGEIKLVVKYPPYPHLCLHCDRWGHTVIVALHYGNIMCLHVGGQCNSLQRIVTNLTLEECHGINKIATVLTGSASGLYDLTRDPGHHHSIMDCRLPP